MGCGAGRLASALRKRRGGEAPSGCSVRIGPYSGSEEAFAATTPDRQPRLIDWEKHRAGRLGSENEAADRIRCKRARRYRSNNFLRREPVELAVTEPQERPQHFTRVLAEERWRDHIFDRRFGES